MSEILVDDFDLSIGPAKLGRACSESELALGTRSMIDDLRWS